MTAVFLGFAIGFMCGATLYAWLTREKSRQPQHGAYPQHFWDVHATLNAVNRVAIANEANKQSGSNVDLTYCLGDHLHHAALLQHLNGWASAQQLEDWLTAIAGLHQHLCDSPGNVNITMEISPSIRRLQIDCLTPALIDLLRSKLPLRSVSIVAHEPSSQERKKPEAKARVSVQMQFLPRSGSPTDGQQLPAPWLATPEGVTLHIDLPFEQQR